VAILVTSGGALFAVAVVRRRRTDG